MTNSVHRFFGYSVDESVSRVPNELEYDAVGLWQIIPVGREDFGLSGLELDEFARKHILALIERGAIPVRASVASDRSWDPQLQYGKTPQEIANSILAEWKCSGVDPDVSGIWFALRSEVLDATN